MNKTRKRQLAALFDSMETRKKDEAFAAEAEMAIVEVFEEEDEWFFELLPKLVKLFRKWSLHRRIASICEKALVALSKKGREGSPDFLLLLNDRGEAEFLDGDFKKAEKTFRVVLKRRQSLPDCSPEDLSEGLNNLALVFKTSGQYSLAEKYYLKALKIREGIRETHPLLYAQAISNLALLYRVLGDYEKAEPFYVSALEIREQHLSPDDPEITKLINSLGVLYLYLGQYQKAETLFQRITDQYESCGDSSTPEYAQLLNNRAGLHYQLGQYEIATDYYDEASVICQKALGPKHLFSIHTAVNRAKADLKQMRSKAALEQLESLLPMCRELLPTGHAVRVTAELNYGIALYQTGSYEESEKRLKETREHTEASFGAHHPITCEILLHLGILQTVRQRLPEALSFLYESCRRQTETVIRVARAFPEPYVVQYMKTLQGSNAILLSFLLEYYATDEAVIEKVFDVMVQRKAVSYESALTQQQAIYDRQELTIKYVLRKLKKVRAELARRVIGEWEQKESREVFFSRLRELEKESENLESQITRLLPHSERYLTLQKASRYSIEAKLPEGGALADFYRFTRFRWVESGAVSGEDQYMAFVLQKEGTLALVSLGNAKAIDEEIEEFREQIHPDKGRRGLLDDDIDEEEFEGTVCEPKDIATRRVLKKGYSLLFDPLIKTVNRDKNAKDVSVWILCSESQLNLVSFEALLTPNGHFVVEDYSVRYVTTPRELLWQQGEADRTERTAVLFANPSFSVMEESVKNEGLKEENPFFRSLRDSLSAFEPLPGTEKEAEEISALLLHHKLPVDTFTKENASKKNFFRLRRPYLLHIATHGFFMSDRRSEELPNNILPSFRSGIVLSGVNNYLQGRTLSKAMQTPILTSFDIFGMNLGGTELVTLSACETGLGLIENGEGVMGLRRAFLTAGAKTVIASLWKVPDEATKTLMALFYKKLLGGCEKSKALREAQLIMIDQYKRRDGFAYPWLWAGFICVGEDNRLFDSESRKEGDAAPKLR